MVKRKEKGVTFYEWSEIYREAQDALISEFPSDCEGGYVDATAYIRNRYNSDSIYYSFFELRTTIIPLNKW